MPTLLYAPVESTTDVPGWTLALPTPLLFAPVEGEVDVPGWFTFVDDPLNEPMTADVFLLADYVADPTIEPLVTLGLDEDRRWDWRDEVSGTGAGTITLPADDPDIGFLDTDDLLAVAFNMYGQRMFLLVIEGDNAIDISDRDEIGEEITCSGGGAGVILELGDVDPSGGPWRSPVEEDRHFGWSSMSFDHSTWVPVNVIGLVDDAANVAAFYLAGGFTPSFPFWQDGIRQSIDAQWPSRNVPVLWGHPGDLFFGCPPGDVYIYQEFTIATGGDYLLYVGMDDRGVTYVDGQQVASVGGINFFGVTSATVTLSAGTHCIASVITNQAFPAPGWNPGKYAWCIIAENNEVTQFLGGLATLFGNAVASPPPIIAQSDGTAVVLSYPSGVPGQSVTKTIRLVIEEAQSRGQLTGVTLGFTDTTFSDGSAVIVLPDVACKVGTSVLGFLTQLAETYIDWDLDPVTLTLRIWAKGDQGVVSPAVFALAPDTGEAGEAELVTANIVGVGRTRERRKVSRLLIRWPGGWAERFGPGGGGEAPLELGSAQSLEEAMRIADGEFATYANPRTQRNITITPEQRDDAPGIGWRKADRVTYAEELHRVAAYTVAVNGLNPEDPHIVVSLGELILTPEQRQAQDMRHLIG